MKPGATPGTVRPRYGRIAAFTGAVLSTLVTVLGGSGVLPVGGAPAQAAAPSADAASLAAVQQAVDPAARLDGDALATTSAAERAAEALRPAAEAAVALPEGSGEGRRVVFDMSSQRVWLVDDAEEVLRTYPVSGSTLDNLAAGTYEVYSRSRHATGIDGSTMDRMVRFTTGENAPIGFHDIPEMDGEPVQTRAQLGTPLSHGCIRQAHADAVALWRFAPVGTQVVVTD